MKIRNGFVSNSSSASFIINKYDISAKQLDQIIDHAEECEKYHMHCGDSDAWSIDSSGHVVEGKTWMDNFDMAEFFRHIGINPDVVRWNY